MGHSASLTTPSLTHQRQQFPALSNKTYFNYGGQGPLPQVALEAIQEGYTYLETEGPFGVVTNDWVTQAAQQTRQTIATELGVSPATITLTENVSIGCNIALWGLPWKTGDHILLTDCEHPGVVAATQELHRRFGVEVSTCPILNTLNHGDPLTVLAHHLRPQTRLVVLSHILWNTGQVLPLKAIIQHCHHHSPGDRPIAVLVDGAQSVGVLPLNLAATEVDFYAFTGHKWWCGPAGLGGLYVRPGTLNSQDFAALQPTFIAWRGIRVDDWGQPQGWQATAQRFELATSAYPLLGGIQKAIATHHQWGTVGERYQRICSLAKSLWDQLHTIPNIQCLCTQNPPPSGLVSFHISGEDKIAHLRLVKYLEEEHRCFVRLLLSPTCIRVSLHYLTLEAEVDQLVGAIASYFQSVETQP